MAREKRAHEIFWEALVSKSWASYVPSHVVKGIEEKIFLLKDNRDKNYFPPTFSEKEQWEMALQYFGFLKNSRTRLSYRDSFMHVRRYAIHIGHTGRTTAHYHFPLVLCIGVYTKKDLAVLQKKIIEYCRQNPFETIRIAQSLKFE
ncbi:MAG: hypothetical protein G01um101466_20 [Parcubacteria group bacterium Gr01-1014_66]|nr:MAG: hypothetical protein G01um101466_20 [Parcubacteria group bacterium Gr01-1014_66]